MKKTIQTIAMAALCLFLSSAALAQTALKIGDQVPDMTINNIINYKSNSAKLSDFKGKLLILDFWATWCGSCIKKFPELGALQKEFASDLQVLLVNTKSTRDTELKIKDFLNKHPITDGSLFSLPTAVNDTLLDALFPHQLIPHYAWIGADGKVKAITSAEQVNKENILQILNGAGRQIAVKKDIDMSRPLFSSEEMPLSSVIHYSTFIKGSLEGVSTGSRYRTANGIRYGRVFTNLPVLYMYNLASAELYPDLLISKVRTEVNDISILDPERSSIAIKDWQKDHLYSYELQVPLAMADQLHQLILNDLNRYSDYQGSLEKKMLSCLVIKKAASYKHIPPDNKPEITLKRLIQLLNGQDGPGIPVKDESGAGKILTFSKPENVTTRAALDQYLKRYGLYTEEAVREFDVFVLRDKVRNK